jgi:hypothetical protein
MKLGTQPGLEPGVDIWGKRKSGRGCSGSCRTAGPPRSSSQYQRPNAMTLVSQMGKEA